MTHDLDSKSEFGNPKSSTLSLCMIVRDEEDCLPHCLNSVRSIVDEIIIVDTGSTDKTIQIAKDFGAKVIQHPWKNDFAEARNVSLQHAACDWILVLDADEIIAERDLWKIERLIRDKKVAGYRLVQRTYQDTTTLT
ncbi:MAG: glycosyltransferase family 2 protein, partial [Pseudomonadota bacterium]